MKQLLLGLPSRNIVHSNGDGNNQCHLFLLSWFGRFKNDDIIII